MNYQNVDRKKLSEVFTRFAENECKGVSDLYYFLATNVAKDKDLLQLASYTRQGQPVPNLLFAAVHYFLLQNPKEELAKYYPSITPTPKTNLPFPLFKQVCLTQSSFIKDILTTKIVQTNAINRTAYLMPIVSALYSEEKAINLVDIGTSAGLNLNLDLYEYNYTPQASFGNSPVKVTSVIKDNSLPPIDKIISIHKKVGIDQNPLDLKIADNATWLKALIWADATARFTRLTEAIKVFQNSTVELIKASTIDEFEKIILQQPTDKPLFVYHTHVLYQFPKPERIKFWAMLDKVGKIRDFDYLAVEFHTVLSKDYGKKGVLIELTNYRCGHGGIKQTTLLGETNGHANWIRFFNR